jgi:N-carbamoyl-L-amino-acid hydrolase
MDRRHDALLAASRFVEVVHRVATSMPGRQVGTVGRLQAFPGAPNLVPGRVTASLELRDLNAGVIDAMFAMVEAEARTIAAATGTTFGFRRTSVNVPAPTDERVRAAIGDAAAAFGLTSTTMPSGAGHDAQHVARIAPAGMIFVPSVGGISHSPAEFTSDRDVENGANVLLGAVLRLDGTERTDD